MSLMRLSYTILTKNNEQEKMASHPSCSASPNASNIAPFKQLCLKTRTAIRLSTQLVPIKFAVSDHSFVWTHTNVV